jgi:hypothetical protein
MSAIRYGRLFSTLALRYEEAKQVGDSVRLDTATTSHATVLAFTE